MIFHLSSLCSGAEYLSQIVNGAIPQVYFQSNVSVPTADISVHVLDYLYKKLDEVCLVQGGEVVATFLDAYNILHLGSWVFFFFFFFFSDYTIKN